MESKPAKTPPINDKTTLLSFDVESNGLHGQAFAVGAVVIDTKGKVLDRFTGRTRIVGQVDPWVEKNVVPVIGDMSITQRTSKDLREDFWRWFQRALETADYVVVSNGYPVEYKFLLECQGHDLEERYWQHPFPILDLTTLMLRIEADASRRKERIQAIMEQGNFSRHHPYDDALVTALAAAQVFHDLNRKQ